MWVFHIGKTTMKAGLHDPIFTTSEITNSLLNRKLLHLSTVVMFQNVNVAVHCQSLWSSTSIHDLIITDIDITACINGLFCEYSKLPLLPHVVLGHS
jgi:hypothetical protein